MRLVWARHGVVPVTEMSPLAYLAGSAIGLVVAGAILLPLFLYGFLAGPAPAGETPAPARGPRGSAA